MKNLKLVSIPFLLLTLSVQARTIKCTESNMVSIDEIGFDILRSKTSVTIKELADVTDEVSYGNRYDSVFKVKVDILERLGAELVDGKSFIAYATSEDVNYQINAVKSNGVKINIFLDEMDQASLELTQSNGKKKRIDLICK